MALATLTAIEGRPYLCRVGPDDWKFGEPYDIAVVILDRGNGVVEIIGLDKPIVPSQFKAIRKALTEAGFHTATFERLNNGQKRTRVVHGSKVS